MRELTVRRHARKAFLALPIVLVGFLIGHFSLLPTHGLPAHAALMSHTAPGASEMDTLRQGTQESGPSSADGSGSAHPTRADGDHRHGDESPHCHAGPVFSWTPPARFTHSDMVDLGPRLFVAAIGITFGRPLLSWLRTRHRQWSSRPPWRPSGTDLLTFTCVSRT